MPKYRKRPIEVEAVQVTEAIRLDMAFPDWARAHILVENTGDPNSIKRTPETERLYVATPEGDMLISDGDWVILGSKGEVYPCKPDIFAMTYDSVLEREAI